MGKPWFACLVAVCLFAACGKDDTKTPSETDEDGGDVTPPETCSDEDAAGLDAFPCDVAPIIEAKCQRCHNAPDVLDECFAAKTCARGPFPLLKWSDTRGSFDGDQTRIYEHIAGVVESRYMPLKAETIDPPVTPLTDDEIATLSDWARNCAPAATAACD